MRIRRINRPIIPLLLAAALVEPVRAQTVAITEFLNNAHGDDNGREFVELYNYGTAAVDLDQWTLRDEDSDSYTIVGATIEAGDFLILVGGDSGLSGAEKKALFEQEWLGGAPEPRVLGIDGRWVFSNSSDEIVLRDASGNIVWNLAYGDDGREGRAVFLSTGDYTISDFGVKGAPGVVSEGFDNDTPDFLGYERNNSALAEDPDAYESSAGNWASPFFAIGGEPPAELHLALTGDCPGSLILAVTHATPGGRLAILYAEAPGQATIPAAYPCAQTELGLDPTAALYTTEWADTTGALELEVTLPKPACGFSLQVLDLENCDTSNVAQP